MTGRKPKKPYDGFPLFPHARGYWAKKICGRMCYFGRIEDGWQAALQRFERERDALYAGRNPADYNTGLTVGRALDLFLSAKDAMVEAGDLKPRTYREYMVTCKAVADALKRTRSVDSLTAAEFEDLRAALAKRFGPVRLSREITQVRTIFRYVYEAGHIDKPIRFGPTFKAPKARELRLNRARQGQRMFEAAELRQLIDTAGQPLKAMVLLGINCGFGNGDCGLLRFSDLDLDHGWHNMQRHKTGIERRAKLWPATIDAIQNSLDSRCDPEQPDLDDLVFITKYRKPWYKDTSDNPVSKQFRKLLDECELYRSGRTFYALRHTFETIAGEGRDQVAVNHIMGHVSNDMASVYRERISDQRLEEVASLTLHWLQNGVLTGVQ